MRWEHKTRQRELGDKRWRLCFAFWPKRFGAFWAWLEFYQAEQTWDKYYGWRTTGRKLR